MDVAKCFKTTVVTTSDSARLPGAEHYAYDHHHSNLAQTQELAKTIVKRLLKALRQEGTFRSLFQIMRWMRRSVFP